MTMLMRRDCPKCQTGTGVAFRVTIVPGYRDLVV